MVAVPSCAKEFVAKSEDENVLDHLLSEVVVNAENLLFLPVWCESLLQFAGAAEVLAKWLLNLWLHVSCMYHCLSSRTVDAAYNDSGNALLGVAVLLQVLRNRDENTGGESHVEDAVGLLAALLELAKVRLELLEALVLVVLARNVRAHLAELVQLLLHLLGRGLDVRLDTLQVLLVVHLCSCIADNLDILGKEVVAVLRRLVAAR